MESDAPAAMDSKLEFYWDIYKYINYTVGKVNGREYNCVKVDSAEFYEGRIKIAGPEGSGQSMSGVVLEKTCITQHLENEKPPGSPDNVIGVLMKS